ncbi:MAG: hypothetical protein J1F38_05335 [Muribaculaceae bacterium]|nr:hypothetical protein [Muribaculaceae bacterium]
MKHRKLGLAKGIALTAMMLTSGMAYSASDLPLIATLKTNIYGYQGPSNNFTIYLGSTSKGVEVYVETATSQQYIDVDPWTLGQDEEGSNAVVATAIPLSVSEKDDEVRIYGDLKSIDLIDAHGCYLSSFVLAGELPNLSVIDLSHNELKSIDLSAQANLASIDLTDNAFTDPSKMVIGTNHPGLLILSVGINDVCDPQLDLKNFPQLQYFSARNNYGITNVDPTGCPNLVSLVLEITNISSIDVTKNPLLDVLNLSQTRVTSVDLSKNTKLGEFYINHEGSFNNEDRYRVQSIDLTNNPLLQYLDLGGNALTSIDLSKNTDLRLLYLQKNQLSSIDVSKMSKLAVLNLSNNNFTYANLPIPQNGWDYYYYRSALPTALKYKVGEPIDFSSSVIRAPYKDAAGNTITPVTYAQAFTQPRAGDAQEIADTDYSFSNGVITFNKAFPDSVYVQFFCDVFPDWPLNSQTFMVKTPEDYDAPSAAFSFTPMPEMAGKTVSLSMGADVLTSMLTYPADVTIIANGEQTVLKGAVTGSGMPGSANVTFTLPSTTGEVVVALADGYSLSALGINGITLNAIDLSASEGLRNLKINNCNLLSINLQYNRALTNLDLSDNRISTIDLTGIRGDYEKYSLSTINLSNNRLVNLSAVSYATIKNLNLSGNRFSSFELKYYTGLQNLDLSNNRVAGTLDFSKVQQLQSANLEGNNITGLVFNTEEGALDSFKSLNVANNMLTFATLPQLSISDYVYAPQQKMSVLATASLINLSAQNIVKNGVGTTYVWKYADNNAVVPATEYSNNGGSTSFASTLVGKQVYCEMTNPLFGAFNSTPLTTSVVTVADKPTNLIATFTTLNSGTAQIGFAFYSEGDNAVYIDWRGDGTDLEPYLYEANAVYPSIYRTGTTFAGANVKVYAYENGSNIQTFAMMNTPLKDLDLSPMSLLQAVNVHGAKLTDGSIKLPSSPALSEIVLDGSSFEKESFAKYENVQSLNLAQSNYTEFDLTPYKNLRYVQFDKNKISNITIGNNRLAQLDLSSNNLKSINLEGAYVEELLLGDNQLTEINLAPVANTLRALVITGNRFTFTTLPDVSNMGAQFTTFQYGNQTPLEVKCYEMKIDLSSQATVNGVATDYYWFLGDYQSDVYYDYELEGFVGEYLEGPDDSDNPEYTIANGVTTFLYDQKRSVICAMINSQYPNLILYTAPTKLSTAGVNQLYGENDGLVDVITLTGVKVKSRVSADEAVKDLAPGIYIIGGKKVVVK